MTVGDVPTSRWNLAEIAAAGLITAAAVPALAQTSNPPTVKPHPLTDPAKIFLIMHLAPLTGSLLDSYKWLIWGCFPWLATKFSFKRALAKWRLSANLALRNSVDLRLLRCDGRKVFTVLSAVALSTVYLPTAAYFSAANAAGKLRRSLGQSSRPLNCR